MAGDDAGSSVGVDDKHENRSQRIASGAGVALHWQETPTKPPSGMLAAMVAYRLRIELPDRPGALAAVTGEIAAANANIVSIDVHEVDGETVVDEVVVEVADTWAPGPLATALAANSDGTLLSSRRIIHRADPITVALDAVAVMVGGEPAAVDAACCRALLGLAHGSSARILEGDAIADDPAASMAFERCSTIVAKDEASGGWQLAAVDDAVDPHAVAVVARSLNVRFSATEVGRAEALVRIRRQVRRTATAPGLSA